MRSRYSNGQQETCSLLKSASNSLCKGQSKNSPYQTSSYVKPGTIRIVQLIVAFLTGCVLTCLLPEILVSVISKLIFRQNTCRITLGSTYKGTEYRTDETFGPVTCLVESKFIKVQQHQVRLASSSNPASKNTVIPDWIWVDYHERINVLVEAPLENGLERSEPHFLIFEQTKYALEGRMSLAIVGGIIEPGGEKPEQAAMREVAEEMHVTCHKMHFLGRFRTDVNRGMGWTHSFLASECSKIVDEVKHVADVADQVGGTDTERQDLKMISLSALRQAVQAGKFLEIQWTATISLAILYLA